MTVAGCFQTLRVSESSCAAVLVNPLVRAVAFTGSTRVGGILH
jgi:acyl-CoA reductase-like NAD-dependent aldehyde dehydrogenase